MKREKLLQVHQEIKTVEEIKEWQNERTTVRIIRPKSF